MEDKQKQNGVFGGTPQPKVNKKKSLFGKVFSSGSSAIKYFLPKKADGFNTQKVSSC